VEEELPPATVAVRQRVPWKWPAPPVLWTSARLTSFTGCSGFDCDKQQDVISVPVLESFSFNWLPADETAELPRCVRGLAGNFNMQEVHDK
jgi:hypothetical protein